MLALDSEKISGDAHCICICICGGFHPMEPPSGSAPAVASAYPSWVVFERSSGKNVVDASKINVNTLAASRTCAGVPILISLSLAAPPASSRICLTIPGGARNNEHSSATVVVAHGDSVLIEVVLDVREQRRQQMTDYLVYNAGDAAGHPTRPPSLLLLPPVNNNLLRQATGLLRRGENELVVVELRIVEGSKGEMAASKMVELFVLRSGKWTVIQPPVSVDGVYEAALMSMWQTRES
ncbi:hypothetical protein QOZ80_8AG0635540 [Eleusine coracana subsp. coracana]|nr:hypothetical protein QOZ80_8AG0635540 [Eleusine coracana subsp. coracana]